MRHCLRARARLLRRVFGLRLGRFAEAHIESADLTDIQPAPRYADLFVRLVDGDRSVHGIIVEVQLERDEEKRYSWPMYAATALARFRCPVDLLVLAPKKNVAHGRAHGRARGG